MNYRSNWETRRPAAVWAANRLLDMLREAGVVDKTWSLNFRKQYIGLKRQNASINFVRFLWRVIPTAEFHLPRDKAIDQNLSVLRFRPTYNKGRYQIRLNQDDFQRSPRLLIDLAMRAKQAHGGQRSSQRDSEELRFVLEKAKKTLGDIEGLVEETRPAINRVTGAVEAEAQRTRDVRATAEVSLQEIQAWANEIPKYRERMNNFEDHMERTEELEQRLEAWLERAVPAGMAAGFRKRRRGFILSKIGWGLLLVVSLGSLAYLAYNDPLRMQLEATFLGALTYVFSRVPYAVPLLWGAFFASRRFVQTLRLEEEYAHKEVLSGAFESYRKHIEEMEKGGSLGKLSETLIEVFLEMLRNHPGWVFRTGQPKQNRLVSRLVGKKSDIVGEQT